MRGDGQYVVYMLVIALVLFGGMAWLLADYTSRQEACAERGVAAYHRAGGRKNL